MKEEKRVLINISKNYRIDFDTLLIKLWDSSEREKFDYLTNETSVVKNKDYRTVLEIVRGIKNKEEKTAYKKEEKKKPKKINDYNFSVGRAVENIKFLSEEEILKIRNELEEDENLIDPISPRGLKDRNALGGALFQAQTSFEGNNKYKSIETAGAAMMYGLSHDHPFYNGNKRTAIVSLLVFLDSHGVHLTCGESELFKISLQLAEHKVVPPGEYVYSDAEIFHLAKWIHANSTIIEKGERPIPLRKLKQILKNFDCIILPNGRVERTTIKKNIFGKNIEEKKISRKVISETMHEGYIVSKMSIKQIREDLCLTSENEIDSKVFYDMRPFTSSDFILKYRNLLRRLSKI